MMKEIDLILLSDTHINIPHDKAKRLRQLKQAMKNIEHEFTFDAVAILGDVSDHGLRSQVHSFAKVVSDFAKRTNTKLLVNLGNHDVFHHIPHKENTLSDMNYLRLSLGQKKQPYIYEEVMIKDTPFLMLNSDERIKTSCSFSLEQRNWLKRTLYKHRHKDYVCILNHQPLCDTHLGSKHYGLDTMDKEIKDILLPYDNIIWISGHIHNRVDDIQTCVNVFGIQMDVPSFQLACVSGRKSGCGCVLNIKGQELHIQVWDFLKMSMLKEFVMDRNLYEEDFLTGKKKLCTEGFLCL